MEPNFWQDISSVKREIYKFLNNNDIIDNCIASKKSFN